MSIDPETLMAYADGELGAIEAKRVERAIAGDPALAAQVEEHRALRSMLAGHFAPVAAEPVPDRLASILAEPVAPLPVRRRPAVPRWAGWSGAVAASLVVGLVIGQGWSRGGDVRSVQGQLYAAGALAHALDDQLATNQGATRVPVSFRDRSGAYCRVFTTPGTDGIACRDGRGWSLRQTRAGTARATTDYAQAGSQDSALMAAAQEMMAGDPLDAAAERRARDIGWRTEDAAGAAHDR